MYRDSELAVARAGNLGVGFANANATAGRKDETADEEAEVECREEELYLIHSMTLGSSSCRQFICAERRRP